MTPTLVTSVQFPLRHLCESLIVLQKKAHLTGGHLKAFKQVHNVKVHLMYCVHIVGKYREFHKLYNNKQFTEAGALLLSLLTARVAPKR